MFILEMFLVDTNNGPRLVRTELCTISSEQEVCGRL